MLLYILCGFSLMWILTIINSDCNAMPIPGNVPFNNSRSYHFNEFGGGNDIIIFPDEGYTDYVPKILHQNCTGNTTYCEDYERYPYDYLESILDGNDQYKNLFSVNEDSDGVDGRISEENYVCPSHSKLIYPKLAKNMKNEWKYIVNSGDNYKQGIRIEVCIREGSTCHIPNYHSTTYITACKQKYSNIRLISVSNDGKISSDLFPLPMACCCSYKPKISFMGKAPW